jgi:hypothetical protein
MISTVFTLSLALSSNYLALDQNTTNKDLEINREEVPATNLEINKSAIIDTDFTISELYRSLGKSLDTPDSVVNKKLDEKVKRFVESTSEDSKVVKKSQFFNTDYFSEIKQEDDVQIYFEDNKFTISNFKEIKPYDINKPDYVILDGITYRIKKSPITVFMGQITNFQGLNSENPLMTFVFNNNKIALIETSFPYKEYDSESKNYKISSLSYKNLIQNGQSHQLLLENSSKIDETDLLQLENSLSRYSLSGLQSYPNPGTLGESVNVQIPIRYHLYIEDDPSTFPELNEYELASITAFTTEKYGGKWEDYLPNIDMQASEVIWNACPECNLVYENADVHKTFFDWANDPLKNPAHANDQEVIELRYGSLKKFEGFTSQVDFSYLIKTYGYTENSGAARSASDVAGYRNPDKETKPNDAYYKGAYAYHRWDYHPTDPTFNKRIMVHEIGHLFNGLHSKANYANSYGDKTLMAGQLNLGFVVDKFSDPTLHDGNTCDAGANCNNLFQIRETASDYNMYRQVYFDSFEIPSVSENNWEYSRSSVWNYKSAYNPGPSPIDGSNYIFGNYGTAEGTTYETAQFQSEFINGRIDGWIYSTTSAYKMPAVWLRTGEQLLNTNTCADGYSKICTGYMVRFYRDEVGLFKWSESGPEELVSYSLGQDHNSKWWHVKFEAVGHTLKAWISEDESFSTNPQLETTDQTYTYGKPAISARASYYTGYEVFDRVVVHRYDNNQVVFQDDFDDDSLDLSSWDYDTSGESTYLTEYNTDGMLRGTRSGSSGSGWQDAWISKDIDIIKNPIINVAFDYDFKEMGIIGIEGLDEGGQRTFLTEVVDAWTDPSVKASYKIYFYDNNGNLLPSSYYSDSAYINPTEAIPSTGSGTWLIQFNGLNSIEISFSAFHRRSITESNVGTTSIIKLRFGTSTQYYNDDTANFDYYIEREVYEKYTAFYDTFEDNRIASSWVLTDSGQSTFWTEISNVLKGQRSDPQRSGSGWQSASVTKTVDINNLKEINVDFDYDFKEMGTLYIEGKSASGLRTFIVGVGDAWAWAYAQGYYLMYFYDDQGNRLPSSYYSDSYYINPAEAIPSSGSGHWRLEFDNSILTATISGVTDRSITEVNLGITSEIVLIYQTASYYYISGTYGLYDNYEETILI